MQNHKIKINDVLTIFEDENFQNVTEGRIFFNQNNQ